MRTLVHMSMALAAACLVFLLPAASAATTDRVQVGRPGQNATPGFPLTLFVTVTTLPDHNAVGRFDAASRDWEGPDYRSSLRIAKSKLSWNVTFASPGSAAAMATRALALRWPLAESPQMRIPHLAGGRQVGSIPAVALLTKGPGDGNAQYESVVAFPLCRGVFAAAQFALLDPGFDFGTSPSDPVLVAGNVPARQWNHDSALAALGQVALEGHLPPGRVTARATGRSIRGTVRDCRGDPMAGVALRLLRGRAVVGRAKVAADGSYRVVAPGRGSYRVAVTLTVTGKGGSGTRADTRAAAVRVR
jgi:hypothetical protein